jgi:hypothetical protein
MLYLEATAYKTLDFKQQNAVGTDPFGAPGLFDAPRPIGASPSSRVGATIP